MDLLRSVATSDHCEPRFAQSVCLSPSLCLLVSLFLSFCLSFLLSFSFSLSLSLPPAHESEQREKSANRKSAEGQQSENRETKRRTGKKQAEDKKTNGRQKNKQQKRVLRRQPHESPQRPHHVMAAKRCARPCRWLHLQTRAKRAPSPFRVCTGYASEVACAHAE